MKWPMEKLGIVAPAKPIKSPKIADSNSVWLLNLDMVESHTGRVIDKLFCSADEAGTSTHWFDENYVLYSKLRPYLNKVVVPDGLGLATTELVPMLPDPERLDKKYLAYYLRSEQFVRWVNEQVAGAKMPRVSMKIFWEHEIPLPPLEEQKRIVTILDKADAIRQKRQQAIALADDFLRSVFLDMFGDPITNPKGWDLSTIGKLGNVITGSTPSSKKTGMFDGDIPFVTPGDLETDAPVSRTLTDEGALNSRTCRKGTTLVCCIGATIGKIGIASRTSAFNQQINAIEWGSEIDDEFGFFAMKLMKATIISSAIQTTLPILNKSAFSALAMYLPPKNLQTKFSKIYKSTCQLNGENKKLTINSNILFDSLLQKSFSGQL
ncbi:restriction endonuclease subunit S [Aeromonas veronii]|uniref:restriction endonuclease subunit S n=1 Tax=Aeromonas veronii TaxID=654 RepID=UPI001117A8BC|nr:restriction endonuclease subunit S [Aeromonas veronii]TNI06853.1 restriction endonuclease [Aeromonas veronii]HDO1311472.1 restriction endonuclease subunit S [Aeromonas veronii]